VVVHTQNYWQKGAEIANKNGEEQQRAVQQSADGM